MLLHVHAGLELNAPSSCGLLTVYQIQELFFFVDEIKLELYSLASTNYMYKF